MTGNTPPVVTPEKPVRPKPGQDIQQPETKPEVIQPGDSRETEPGKMRRMLHSNIKDVLETIMFIFMMVLRYFIQIF